MTIDKSNLAKLKKFADVFKAARERNANESDTVMYLVKFFEEVLSYDPLSGEITKEVPVKERYCDFAIVLDNSKGEESKPEFLVEAKAAGVKSLNAKHIEQASNYAANRGVNWVVLTNGASWHLYHLNFDKETGINSELVFELDILERLETEPDYVWDTLCVLAKSNVEEGGLETYYEQTKLLSPKTIVNTLVSEEVLMKIRQELNHHAPARLDIKDVFRAVMHVLNPEAVAAAGDITPPVRRRRRRRRHQADEVEQPQTQNSAPPPQIQPESTDEEEIPR